MSKAFNINSDISLAKTLPSSFYRCQSTFDKIRDDIFLKSWQFVGDNSQIKINNSFSPQTLLDGFLTEPIVLTRDDNNQVNCLTNVLNVNPTSASSLNPRSFGKRLPKR